MNELLLNTIVCIKNPIGKKTVTVFVLKVQVKPKIIHLQFFFKQVDHLTFLLLNTILMVTFGLLTALVPFSN